MNVIVKLRDVSNLASSIRYLKRREGGYSVICSDDIEANEYIVLNKKGKSQCLIISPERECDLSSIVKKTISYIKKSTNAQIHFIAYIHTDTDHSHIHLIITFPKTSKSKITEPFVRTYLYPYLKREIEKEVGKRSEEEEREYYKESVYNDSTSIVDYDIKRLCVLDKTRQYRVYVKEKENKVEEWKKPYIKKRIEILKNRGYCAERKGYTIFLKNFIPMQIRKRRLKDFENVKDIDEKKVICKYIKKEDRVEIIDKKENKFIISYLARGKDNNIYLFEEKRRSDER